MKAKQFLFIAVVVAILVSAVAIPVAAEDEIPMWVNSIRIALKGRETSSSAKLVGTVAIRDANKEPVAGASVVVNIYYPDNQVWLTGGQTSSQGTISFTISKLVSGTYELCVFSVAKEGWEYDPELNKETCETYDVP